ncbi:hypothetical protein GCM10027341_22480 [Spirosoma knui]
MTDKDFIKAIVDLYRSSRLTTFSVENVTRCKNRPISGFAEDTLAFYISHHIDTKNGIFIEPEVQVLLNGKKKMICPDVLILRTNGSVKQMWDIKMDLGRRRDSFVQFCKDKSQLVNNIKGTTATFSGREIVFSDELTFNIVVIISDTNISKQKGQTNIQQTRNIVNVGVFFLTSKLHPNNKDISVEELLKSIETTSDFKDFQITVANGG